MARRQITRKDHKFDCREHLWSFAAVWRCTVNSSMFAIQRECWLNYSGKFVLTRADSSSTVSAFSEIWISQRHNSSTGWRRINRQKYVKYFSHENARLTSSTTMNKFFLLTRRAGLENAFNLLIVLTAANHAIVLLAKYFPCTTLTGAKLKPMPSGLLWANIPAPTTLSLANLWRNKRRHRRTTSVQIR